MDWLRKEYARYKKSIKSFSQKAGIASFVGWLPLMYAFEQFVAAYILIALGAIFLCFWWWTSIHAKTQVKIDKRYRYTPNLWKQIPICVLTIALGLFCIWVVKSSQDKYFVRAMEGVLKPIKSGKATKALLEWGNSGFIEEFNDKHPSYKPLFDQEVKVELIDKTPTLTTTIRDSDGKIIVRIDKNHWQVNSSQAVVMDKNYTSNSLEVLNSHGHVVFRAEVLPDRVRLVSEFYDEHGLGVRIGNGDDLPVKGGMSIIPLNSYSVNPADQEATQIKPHFLYPSSEHWGELVK